MAELVPNVGTPVDVQRRLEFSLAPELEWSVLCYLDLETLKADGAGEAAPTVVDFEVKAASSPKRRPTATPRPGSTTPDVG